MPADRTCFGGLEHLFGRIAQQHEFAARHLDLLDLEPLQLHDHVIDREAVVGVRADAKIEPSGRRQWHCRQRNSGAARR